MICTRYIQIIYIYIYTYIYIHIYIHGLKIYKIRPQYKSLTKCSRIPCTIFVYFVYFISMKIQKYAYHSLKVHNNLIKNPENEIIFTYSL